MRTATCQRCHQSTPIADLARVDNRAVCPACVDDLIESGGSQVDREALPRLDDPTICAQCGKDNGTNSLAVFAGRPLCPACFTQRTRRPLPILLGLLSAATLAVVGLAAVSAIPLQRPAILVIEAEKMIGEGRHADAVKRLRKALELDRNVGRARLLLVKALLLSDELEQSKAEMGRLQAPKGALGRDVLETAERVKKAMLNYNIAVEAYRNGRMDAAAEFIDKARHDFPESRQVAAGYLLIRGLLAFDRGDLHGYIESHDLLRRMLPNDLEAQLASALSAAGRFALDGKDEDKKIAREILKSAGGLVKTEKQQDLLREVRQEVLYRFSTRDMRRYPSKPESK